MNTNYLLVLLVLRKNMMVLTYYTCTPLSLECSLSGNRTSSRARSNGESGNGGQHVCIVGNIPPMSPGL